MNVVALPHRTLLRNVVPGLVLPGLIYLVASRFAPTMMALAAASSVPVLDALFRVIRRRPVSAIGLGFVAMTAVSVSLAMWLRSPMFILARGAVVSALVGSAFAVSAFVRRPLTRTLALHLSTDQGEDRRALAEKWRHPKAMQVFCTLSAAWGVLLLITAGQQLTLALTVRPGLVMVLDPPMHAVAVAIGTAASIVYVRKHQRAHPELAILPMRPGSA